MSRRVSYSSTWTGFTFRSFRICLTVFTSKLADLASLKMSLMSPARVFYFSCSPSTRSIMNRSRLPDE